MYRKIESSGFSLIEALVITGVVGSLSAILIPVLGKLIDDVKISRALEDCKTIANAIEQFYSDLGTLPTLGSTGMPGEVYTLVTGSSVTTTAPYGFASDNTKTLYWLTGGSGTIAKADVLSNHLTFNTPKGQSTNVYKATTATPSYWKGPYLPVLGSDPWGHPYIATLVAPSASRAGDEGDGSYCQRVVSAGPNGVVDTNWHPTGTGTRRVQLAGDDIGVRIGIDYNE